MRETFRLNRDKFPSSGDLLFLLKRTDDERGLIDEMYQLSDKLMRIASKRFVPRGTKGSADSNQKGTVPRGTDRSLP